MTTHRDDDNCAELHDALVWNLWEHLERRHGEVLASWEIVRMPVSERVTMVLQRLEGWTPTRTARAVAGRLAASSGPGNGETPA